MPPKKIKNKTYENQNEILDNPVVQQIKMVWNNKASPIARGCKSWVNIIDVIMIKG